MAKPKREIIEWVDLPWSPQDYAFEEVAKVFGLNEDMIDAMPSNKRTEWAGFVEAVAACHTRDEDGEVAIMNKAALLDLYDMGESSEINFTDFALFALSHRHEQVSGNSASPILISPEAMYASAIWHFRQSKAA